MSEMYEYLTDEELEALITEVEESELNIAPPELLENILMEVGLGEKEYGTEAGNNDASDVNRKIEKPPKNSNIVQFRRFQISVGIAVAVAVMFILFAPLAGGRINGIGQSSGSEYALTGFSLKIGNNSLMSTINGSKAISESSDGEKLKQINTYAISEYFK